MSRPPGGVVGCGSQSEGTLDYWGMAERCGGARRHSGRGANGPYMFERCPAPSNPPSIIFPSPFLTSAPPTYPLQDLAQLETQFAGAPVTVVGVHSAKFDNEKDRCGGGRRGLGAAPRTAGPGLEAPTAKGRTRREGQPGRGPCHKSLSYTWLPSTGGRLIGTDCATHSAHAEIKVGALACVFKYRAARREPMTMQKRPTCRNVVAGVPNLTCEMKYKCRQPAYCIWRCVRGLRAPSSNCRNVGYRAVGEGSVPVPVFLSTEPREGNR